MSNSIVAYIRVSTRKQDDSGLGQEAQETAVAYYAKCNGAEIIDTFSEVESGKKSDRPELATAITRCRQTGATLVVAKLDRLARNVEFLSYLMKSDVPFLALDQPHANKLTLTILMAVAEDEADRTSQRTKAALAAYKARGGKLGGARPECRNLTATAAEKGRRLGADAKANRAKAYYAGVMQTIQTMHGMTHGAIADELNNRRIRNASGRPWTAAQVYRVLERYGQAVDSGA